MLDRVDLADIDVGAPVGSMSLAVRQLIEIAKVLGELPKMLIFDKSRPPHCRKTRRRRCWNGSSSCGMKVTR
jgi:hypothetical protein